MEFRKYYNNVCEIITNRFISIDDTITKIINAPNRPFFIVGTDKGEICLIGYTNDDAHNSQYPYFFICK